jgi:ElaB/YqjD/DUF883 family membrane-anchored ribosome-binding protein
MTDQPTQEKDQEQLQHEIEDTRAELGDTVDALAQKADVKARVSEQVEQRKAALRERQEDIKAMVKGTRERAEERPLPAIAVALGVGLLLGRAIGRR